MNEQQQYRQPTEAVVSDRGGVNCSRCIRPLEEIHKRIRYGKRGRRSNEVVGWRCPKCGAGFNASLASDSSLDRKRGRR